MNLKGLDEKQISDELPWVNLTIFLRSTSQTDKWEEILHLRDKYVTMKILKKFDLVNVKAAITPMETKDEESFDVDVHLYRSMIGKLQVFLISMLSEGSLRFAEIVDFLRGSNLRYALTSNPTIYDSLVKQFWQTATANTKADGSLEINATIDTIGYTIHFEASIRDSL
ncbi:hypothetical protein Tco_0890578 [Tanacetum coccineum]|uniref:Uncharacterized protein n=1 Tax=Tanacetum coccineum TaxID=301880 RepID=A0ABQ5C3T6_9ASTR